MDTIDSASCHFCKCDIEKVPHAYWIYHKCRLGDATPVCAACMPKVGELFTDIVEHRKRIDEMMKYAITTMDSLDHQSTALLKSECDPFHVPLAECVKKPMSDIVKALVEEPEELEPEDISCQFCYQFIPPGRTVYRAHGHSFCSENCSREYARGPG